MKCVIPTCRNTEEATKIPFFRVPPSSSKYYPHWKKFMVLSGQRTEKICRDHFRTDDFLTYRRKALKTGAVPVLRLPQVKGKVDRSGVCCVKGCKTKTDKFLYKFPSQPGPLASWRAILGQTDSSKLKICHRHFRTDDFSSEIRYYLKPGAVPSKKVVKLLKYPKRYTRSKDPPKHIWDHAYCKWYSVRPKSNKICYVEGCHERAGQGVALHKFPAKEEYRFQLWVTALKCRLMPTKNSTVCSKHFKKSDFLIGQKRLKNTAVPSKRVPGEEVFYTSSSTDSSPNSSCAPKRFKDDDPSDLPTAGDPDSPTASIVLENCPLSPVPKDSPSEQHPVNDGHGPVTPQEGTCSEWEVSKESVKLVQSTIKELNNKHLILSDLLISDKEVSIWTGIPTLVQLQEICLAVRRLEDRLFPRGFKMDVTDRVILTMSKLKQNITFEALGTLFRISGVTVSSYFSHTIQLLARLLNRFVYWPDRSELKKNVPLCFREHFPRVTVILDATEIPVCTLKCLNCRIACFSSYKSRRTIKFLVGVSPAGLITFISSAYSGKASDKQIFNEEGLIDRLIPNVDEIMVDKGVSIEKECTLKCIKLHIPPFMRGEQLSPLEASENEAIARARIHVERVIQRIKIFSILTTTVNFSVLPHIDFIMQTICGIVNLTAPVLSDDKF